VKVNPKPKANFVPTPPNVTTINPKSIMMNTSLNAVDYSWIFSDGLVSSDASPEHEFPNKEQSKQVVILIATSDAGCKDTTNKIINVNEEVIYYIPNTFTPDDDDFNQVFKPVFTSGYDPFSYHLTIFNRWGELVFESYDSSIGWSGLYGKDGAVVQEGSYTWKIDFKLKENDAHKVEVGSVNILK
jgi:gliding motility-associated-like protein